MAYNWQNMLSGIGLYLFAVGLIYGRKEYYPKKAEKTNTIQTIIKADKRDKDNKVFPFGNTQWSTALSEVRA